MKKSQEEESQGRKRMPRVTFHTQQRTRGIQMEELPMRKTKQKIQGQAGNGATIKTRSGGLKSSGNQ